MSGGIKWSRRARGVSATSGGREISLFQITSSPTSVCQFFGRNDNLKSRITWHDVWVMSCHERYGKLMSGLLSASHVCEWNSFWLSNGFMFRIVLRIQIINLLYWSSTTIFTSINLSKMSTESINESKDLNARTGFCMKFGIFKRCSNQTRFRSLCELRSLSTDIWVCLLAVTPVSLDWP